MRRYLFTVLENPDRTSNLGKLFDFLLILLIVLNVVAVVVESIDWIRMSNEQIFWRFEVFSVLIFTAEYILRFWVCVERNAGTGHASARLVYVLSPMAIIDLLAIAPFYLAMLVSLDLRFLRVLRLLRVFKLTRYSSAMTMLLDVFREEAGSFLAGFFILSVMLILASSGAYLVEHSAQPDKFGSIPGAMWWAMATLTTVGYGDVTPITPAGKFFGGIVTIIGVGVAALPAGILASGLADQLRRKRELMAAEFRKALEDGVIRDDEMLAIENLRRKLGLSATMAIQIREDILRRRAAAGVEYCPKCGHHMPR